MSRLFACSLEFLQGRCPAVWKLCTYFPKAVSDQPPIKATQWLEAYYSSLDAMFKCTGLTTNDPKPPKGSVKAGEPKMCYQAEGETHYVEEDSERGSQTDAAMPMMS